MSPSPPYVDASECDLEHRSHVQCASTALSGMLLPLIQSMKPGEIALICATFLWVSSARATCL